MDPESNLQEQRDISKRLIGNELTENETSELALRLAELVDALDTWIKSGGFLPSDWRAPYPG